MSVNAVNSLSADTPLVSIVMATYNGARFINEQLDSIFAQDYPNIEIIASDDKSTDSTVDILEDYQKTSSTYPMAIYSNESNLGYTKNFEQALRYCKGDYIAFCDQDDIWEPNKVSTQILAIQKNKSLATYSDAFLVDDSGHNLNIILWSAVLGETPPENVDFRAFYLKNCVTGCTLLIHRKLLESALPFPASVPHDWWLAYQAAYHKRLTYSKKKLIHYRQHGGNVFGAGSKIRKKKLSYYLKYKLESWNICRLLRKTMACSFFDHQRLKSMYDFELKTESSCSTELIKLNKWLDDSLNGRDLSKYQDFFQSQSPAFQLFINSKQRPLTLNQAIKKIVNRYIRGVVKVILFFAIVYWVSSILIT